MIKISSVFKLPYVNFVCVCVCGGGGGVIYFMIKISSVFKLSYVNFVCVCVWGGGGGRMGSQRRSFINSVKMASV